MAAKGQHVNSIGFPCTLPSMRIQCALMGTRMKALFDRDARKRPVNLTLNEDLVAQAKSIADNLSGVVETLLAEYVAREQSERLAKSKAVAETMAAWNDFADEHGSFADEHSTL